MFELCSRRYIATGDPKCQLAIRCSSEGGVHSPPGPSQIGHSVMPKRNEGGILKSQFTILSSAIAVIATRLITLLLFYVGAEQRRSKQNQVRLCACANAARASVTCCSRACTHWRNYWWGKCPTCPTMWCNCSAVMNCSYYYLMVHVIVI